MKEAIKHVAEFRVGPPLNLRADTYVTIYDKGGAQASGVASRFNWSATGDLNEIVAYIIGTQDKAANPTQAKVTAATILAEMGQTYAERNKVYGSNYKMVGPIMKILFPDGVPEHLPFTDQFHLFELILVKLSRFAISGLTHVDSIHDSAVYGSMIEAILHNEEERKQHE